MADASYGPKVYKDNGGDRINLVSGATLNVESGATETHANIPAFTNAGGFVLGAAAPAAAGAQQSLVKTVTGIADAAATTVLTVTVPNAAHAALIPINILASLGAGGAVGAFEASAVAFGYIAVTRTAGVATVATAVAVSNAGSAAVAGAATITLAYSVTSMTGAVGATQTFNVQVTITKGSGASAAHQAIVGVDMVNANAAGITIA